MSKFKLTQTATEVQDILNNSLQKPTGLTKTKLVGVGVNGQENIEIGDNLTLANGKLAAMGSLPSTITFDENGNRTVGKNLGVDGKLKLKSLVSASNPDGDITKALGGGGSTLYEYTAVFLDQSKLGIDAYVKFYSSVDIGQENKVRTSRELYQKLFPAGSQYELTYNLSGYIKIDTKYFSLSRMTFGTYIYMHYLDPEKGIIKYSHDFRYDTTNTWNVIRNIASPRHQP